MMRAELAPRFDRTETHLSPRLGAAERGLAVAADEFHWFEGVLSVPLAVTVRLSQPEYARFRDVVAAVVLSVECPDTGDVAAFKLVDPGVVPYDSPAPNFDAAREWGNPDASNLAFASVVLDVAFGPGDAPRRVYLRATLNQYHSRTLELDLEARTVTEHP